jgi:hypothetical protein
MADQTAAINFPGERAQVTRLFLQYSYLQVLDFLTTLAFLMHGVREANPLVRFFVGASSSPINGLLIVKLLAVLLGVYCWRMGRGKLLGRINILFAALVAWNLVALILSGVPRT